METVEESVLIHAPAGEVFDRYRQMEPEFSMFMQGVEEMTPLDERQFLLRTRRDGVEQEFVCEIILEVPAHRLAWRTLSGPDHSGVVAFEFAPGDTTTVRVKMSYSLETGWGPAEIAGPWLRANLERLKARMENDGTPSGA